ncbi:hypothetical protein ACXIUS_29700 [Bosea thiooxidans]
MKYVLAAAALIATCSMARAEEDAALTLCETLIKAELVAPKSYERVSAYIDGLTVKVTYDAVNKYNAPLRHTDSCSFSGNSNSGFIIEPKTNPEEIGAAIEALKSSPVKDEEDRQARLKKLRQIQNDAEYEIRRQALAIASGEYPIPASKTALK